MYKLCFIVNLESFKWKTELLNFCECNLLYDIMCTGLSKRETLFVHHVHVHFDSVSFQSVTFM